MLKFRRPVTVRLSLEKRVLVVQQLLNGGQEERLHDRMFQRDCLMRSGVQERS